MTNKEFDLLMEQLMKVPAGITTIYNKYELIATKELISALRKIRKSLIKVKDYYLTCWKHYTALNTFNEALATEALFNLGQATTGLKAISLHIDSLISAKRNYNKYLFKQIFSPEGLRLHQLGYDRSDIERPKEPPELVKAKEAADLKEIFPDIFKD